MLLLGVYLKRLDKRRDIKTQEREKLFAENKELKEKELNTWRDGYTKTQCQIKNTVDKIEVSLNGKVWVDDCKGKHKEVWDAIDSIRDKQYNAKGK
jgi:uncharacterized Fe-S cluster-containing protein